MGDQAVELLEALRASEARYRGLFEANRDAIVTATLERRLVDVNPAFTRLLGYTREELVGRSSACLYADEAAYRMVGEAVRADPARRTPLVLEAPMRRKDGTVLQVEVSSYVLRDAQDRPTHLVGVLRDLTAERQVAAERAAADRALREEKAFAEDLVENLPTGVAYLDRDLVFRVANPVYAAFLQRTPAEIKDRFLFDVLPADRSQIEPILRRVIDTGVPYYGKEFEFVYATPEGTERTTYWDFVYYPVRASADEPVRGVFALADEISGRIAQERAQRELKAEQERLQRERLEALEQADRLKDQFLSILSHELRTPINAIMGFGSILADEVVGPMSDDQRRYAGKILSSADDLLALIEDLLFVSRVQAGKFSVSPQPCALPELVEATFGSQAPVAEARGLALVADLPAGLPQVAADRMRVVQVLTNLVGNALKFTPEGGTVTVRARAAGDRVRCEVVDTGPGIATEDQPKLFQRFAQLDMSNTRAASGAGLGLSIVKAIVTAHGGEVGVTSAPGQGSTFWFTLPLAEAPSSPAGPGSRP